MATKGLDDEGTKRTNRGVVTQECLFPPSAFVQCDNPGCVFFIEGWTQRIPFEKRERRTLAFQCPACDSFVKIRARRISDEATAA